MCTVFEFISCPAFEFISYPMFTVSHIMSPESSSFAVVRCTLPLVDFFCICMCVTNWTISKAVMLACVLYVHTVLVCITRMQCTCIIPV